MNTSHDCACLTATGNCTAHAYTDRKGRIVGMKRCTRNEATAHSCIGYYPSVRNGVAICDQLEDPRKSKKIVKRGSVSELITPSNQ